MSKWFDRIGIKESRITQEDRTLLAAFKLLNQTDTTVDIYISNVAPFNSVEIPIDGVTIDSIYDGISDGKLWHMLAENGILIGLSLTGEEIPAGSDQHLCTISFSDYNGVLCIDHDEDEPTRVYSYTRGEFDVHVYGCYLCGDDADPDDCPEDEVEGCINAVACNYNSLANVDDGSCLWPCGSGGECDDINNYNACYDCDGNCICEPDCAGICGGDDVIDVCGDCAGGIEDPEFCPDVFGCTNSECDNFNSEATVDDGSCNCVYGCMDTSACNYDASVTSDDGTCDYCTPTPCYLQDGSGTEEQCLCPGEECSGGYDTDPESGCMDSAACNYDSDVDVDNGSCTYEVDHCYAADGEPNWCDSDDSANYELYCLGNAPPGWIPVEDSGGYDVYGCMNSICGNYNSVATIDDGSCTDCGDIGGCTDPLCENYNSNATVDDGSCENCYSGSCDCLLPADTCDGVSDPCGGSCPSPTDEDRYTSSLWCDCGNYCLGTGCNITLPSWTGGFMEDGVTEWWYNSYGDPGDHPCILFNGCATDQCNPNNPGVCVEGCVPATWFVTFNMMDARRWMKYYYGNITIPGVVSHTTSAMASLAPQDDWMLTAQEVEDGLVWPNEKYWGGGGDDDDDGESPDVVET